MQSCRECRSSSQGKQQVVRFRTRIAGNVLVSSRPPRPACCSSGGEQLCTMALVTCTNNDSHVYQRAANQHLSGPLHAIHPMQRLTTCACTSVLQGQVRLWFLQRLHASHKQANVCAGTLQQHTARAGEHHRRFERISVLQLCCFKSSVSLGTASLHGVRKYAAGLTNDCMHKWSLSHTADGPCMACSRCCC
jgi:hypothetical protein